MPKLGKAFYSAMHGKRHRTDAAVPKWRQKGHDIGANYEIWFSDHVSSEIEIYIIGI